MNSQFLQAPLFSPKPAFPAVALASAKTFDNVMDIAWRSEQVTTNLTPCFSLSVSFEAETAIITGTLLRFAASITRSIAAERIGIVSS